MVEPIDLRWKELCGELILRKKGKKGEWDIPTDVLIRLFEVRKMRVPMVIMRNVPEAGEKNV